MQTTDGNVSPRKRRERNGHPLAIALARLMAGAALLNLGLVLFDMSYISLRDFYGARLPMIPRGYDRVKGIEPYRDTADYLQSVRAFESAIASSDLTHPSVQMQLEQLRTQSLDMVIENPFQLANKSGTLERIKNRMRDHLKLKSSKDAFETFWSSEYLQNRDVQTELNWFNRRITPLVETNYFRPISESGGFTDYFWLIDLGFVGLFGLDILIRTLLIRRRRPSIGLLDAFLWRWYDWFLLIPFWRFLRIVPVTLRCHQVGWIDLGHIENQVTGYLAENLLDDLSEMILLRVFNIAQSSVKGGNLQKWLSTQREMVDLNNVNEIQIITERLIRILVMKVLPEIQPDLEAVLRHAIEQGLHQLPVYKDLQFLPGINIFPNELTKQIVHQMMGITSQTLEETLKDEKGQALATHLAESAVKAFQAEIQDPVLLAEFQHLISDMLEEWKLTLLQSFESQDVEQTATEIAQIRQAQTLRMPSHPISFHPVKPSPPVRRR
jgi:hypothetical protein